MISRRRLLHGALAAAAASACPISRRAPAAEGRSARKMTIDLVCGAIGVKANQVEAIDLAHRHGFESVAPDPGFLGTLDDGQLADLAAEMKQKQVVFGAAGLPVDFRGDETTFRTGLEALPRASAALERAGVTRVGTWLRPSHSELTYLANFKQHAQRLREIAKVLADHGQRFGLEYVGPKTSWSASRHPFVHCMAETKELIAAIEMDNVGFVLDSWHWYTAGEGEADLLTLTNRDVVACDLNDAPAGIPIDEQIDSRRELPAATGVIDVATFLRALVKIGYDGPVRAEPFNAALRALSGEEAVAATATAMRRAFATLD
ncbi:MAG: sugar phosphate isomerase/epimerase family protein [Pirellulales bacterium]